MLRVALNTVHAGPVDTSGEVAADDPLFAWVGTPLAAPITVHGRLSTAGEGKYYWRVQFETTVRAECRRCLVSVEQPVAESRGLIFSADEETPEGDGCYIVPARANVLDLAEAL